MINVKNFTHRLMCQYSALTRHCTDDHGELELGSLDLKPHVLRLGQNQIFPVLSFLTFTRLTMRCLEPIEGPGKTFHLNLDPFFPRGEIKRTRTQLRHHQSIHKSQDIRTHRIDVPVLRTDMGLFRRSRLARTVFLRFVGAKFTSWPLLAQSQIFYSR